MGHRGARGVNYDARERTRTMVTVGMQTLEKKPRKKRRDKDKPKRAMSAYLVFLNKHRDATQKKNPSWSVTDVTKELAGKWKTVTQSERDECQRVSDEDKARYYREMQNYVPLPDEKEEPPLRFDKDGNRKRRKKDKNAPRKNRSSYIIWAQEYRDKTFRPKANTPDAVSFRDQAAQLGAAWKACTPQQRKKYDDMAEKEAQAYAIKRDAYKAEQKAIALAAREAKRQRLLDEKRAWEATKIAAAQLKEEKNAQLSPGTRDRSVVRPRRRFRRRLCTRRRTTSPWLRCAAPCSPSLRAITRGAPSRTSTAALRTKSWRRSETSSITVR